MLISFSPGARTAKDFKSEPTGVDWSNLVIGSLTLLVVIVTVIRN